MSRKIRFATIGSGAIVESFIKGAMIDERFEYAAIYSRTVERGDEFAAKYGVTKVYTSLDALAADPGIDAVYIASPNVCHVSQAVLMMNHGKHVLCEKPIAPTYSEALGMIECARKNGVALMEAMKSTLLPNFFAIRDALPRIGRVFRYTAQFCQYSSRFKSFLSGEGVANVFNPKMKGGALLDLGVYGVAPLIHLFGMPERVQKSEVRMVPGGEIVGADVAEGIDVQGTLLLSYPQMEGVVSYSKVSDSYLPLEIQGERGCIVVSKLSQMTAPRIKYRPTVSERRPGAPALTYDDSVEEDISRPTYDENMYYELKEFIDIIEDGRIESVENSFERSLDVLKVCEIASLRSQ